MLPDNPYTNGYAAGLELNDDCPHLWFTLLWFWWWAGHAVGVQTLANQLQVVFHSFPQD